LDVHWSRLFLLDVAVFGAFGCMEEADGLKITVGPWARRRVAATAPTRW
jgi:hypothetical protein